MKPLRLVLHNMKMRDVLIAVQNVPTLKHDTTELHNTREQNTRANKSKPTAEFNGFILHPFVCQPCARTLNLALKLCITAAGSVLMLLLLGAFFCNIELKYVQFYLIISLKAVCTSGLMVLGIAAGTRSAEMEFKMTK